MKFLVVLKAERVFSLVMHQSLEGILNDQKQYNHDYYYYYDYETTTQYPNLDCSQYGQYYYDCYYKIVPDIKSKSNKTENPFSLQDDKTINNVNKTLS